MVIARILPYCLFFVSKFPCFLLAVLRLAFRMLRMVIARVWALLSAICAKVSLFCAVGFFC